MTKSISWRQLIYYGEVIGFLAAWGVGLVIALGVESQRDESRDPDGLAVVSTGR